MSHETYIRKHSLTFELWMNISQGVFELLQLTRQNTQTGILLQKAASAIIPTQELRHNNDQSQKE